MTIFSGSMIPAAMFFLAVLAAIPAIVSFIRNRQADDGSLGGGWGDDIELMGLLASVLAPKQLQEDRRLIDALEGMARYGWVDQQWEPSWAASGGGATGMSY